jgi:hypothetical protein
MELKLFNGKENQKDKAWDKQGLASNGHIIGLTALQILKGEIKGREDRQTRKQMGRKPIL